MTLTDFDKRRIGQDYAEAFEKSNLALMASRHSQTPGVLDGESVELEHRVYALFYAILMQVFPTSGLVCSRWGANLEPKNPGSTDYHLSTTFIAIVTRFLIA